MWGFSSPNSSHAQKDSSRDHCWTSGASYWSDASLRHTWWAFSCSNMTKPVTMISSTHGWSDWESQLFYNFNSAWEPFTLQCPWIKFLTIHFTKHADFWRAERSEDMDQIRNKTCCHQGMIFLKDNRKTETELQALHITVQLHTNNFVIASATILLIQSPVLQNQITRHFVFDWRSLGVMRVYKSSYWFMSNPGWWWS
jgi:hypothetical protein